MRLWQFFTIILVALVAGLAFAHVLEQPAKMQYSGDLYLVLQRTLYLHWGPPNVGGILEPAAVASTAVLAYLVRRQRWTLWLVLVAVATLVLAFPVVFYWLVAPANAAFRGVAGDPVPENWSALRDSWELGHAIRFGLQFVALGALVASAVWREFEQRRIAEPGAAPDPALKVG